MLKKLKFEIERLEILDTSGKVDSKLMPKLTSKQIKELYYWMVLSREFDAKALKLQRSGRLGTFATQLGQEATVVGTTYALRKQDWLFPSFRNNAGMMIKGVKMEQLYQYWGGDERGMQYSDDCNTFPVCITVAEQALHGMGYAWGAKLKKDDVVVLSDFGDGGSSEGDFHEALNFAGVFKLPVIFVCQNNQFAISLSRKDQTASATIAQKAIAYGIKGIQVDGNDIFAVYKATADAVKDAKKGIPTLIECETFRMGDHTTSDDAARYRTEKIVKEWAKKDPIERMKKYMEAKKIWFKKDEEDLKKRVEKEVSDSVDNYLKIPVPPREDMFKYLFAGGGE